MGLAGGPGSIRHLPQVSIAASSADAVVLYHHRAVP